MTIAYDYITGDYEGLSTLFVLPAIPDDAPASVREGIARRRLATIGGECPCGGRRPRLTRQQRRAAHRHPDRIERLEVQHEPDCPAVAEDTVAWLRGGRRSPR